MFRVVEHQDLEGCDRPEADQVIYSMRRRLVVVPWGGESAAATPTSGVNALESTTYSKVGGGGSSWWKLRLTTQEWLKLARPRLPWPKVHKISCHLPPAFCNSMNLMVNMIECLGAAGWGLQQGGGRVAAGWRQAGLQPLLCQLTTRLIFIVIEFCK